MQHEHDDAANHGWKSWIWMVLCCVPMIAIIAVTALGLWGFR